MLKSELIRLRELVKAEIARREQINQALDNEEVLRYLGLVGQSTEKFDLNNIQDMLGNILKDFQVTQSNGIYVCTKAYDEDNSGPVLYYYLPEGSCGYDHKHYRDIETGKEVQTNWIYGPSISDFERSHIVLNPYNASYKDEKIRENGYEDVRLDFFAESFKHGQNSAVQYVLKKYPRIGERSSRK